MSLNGKNDNMTKTISDTEKQFFRDGLMNWFSQNHRPLPWKGEADPYLIWLSEIILQQTRVEQGLPYFLKFKSAYPTVNDLAAAPEDEIMKNWEGLGYYSRARNMHHAAKFMASKKGGNFPKTYEEILSLKGVGPYTAAAIASFAYNLPYAVVDGNVFRVLSRFFGIGTPIDTTKGKKLFQQLAQVLLDTQQAGVYNQAIMDFGATHCMPQTPKCQSCPLKSKCLALQQGKVKTLPVKSKKLIKKERFFYYLVIQAEEEVLIQKRTQKDIWEKLYQFPLIEKDSFIEEVSMLQKASLWQQFIGKEGFEIKSVSRPFKQVLTHQKIIAVFVEIILSTKFNVPFESFVKVKRKNLFKFAFPKIIDLYLQDNSLYLRL